MGASSIVRPGPAGHFLSWPGSRCEVPHPAQVVPHRRSPACPRSSPGRVPEDHRTCSFVPQPDPLPLRPGSHGCVPGHQLRLVFDHDFPPLRPVCRAAARVQAPRAPAMGERCGAPGRLPAVLEARPSTPFRRAPWMCPKGCWAGTRLTALRRASAVPRTGRPGSDTARSGGCASGGCHAAVALPPLGTPRISSTRADWPLAGWTRPNDR